MIRQILGAIAGALAELPRNDHLWSYTIQGFDGSPYIDRTLLPRIRGYRVMLHKLHRGDQDRWLHNHPWRTAKFLIAAGGYVEERIVNGKRTVRRLTAGDVNTLDAGDFHRIIEVATGTWSIALVGERCQEWGFLVDDQRLVPSAEYFASKQYVSKGANS